MSRSGYVYSPAEWTMALLLEAIVGVFVGFSLLFDALQRLIGCHLLGCPSYLYTGARVYISVASVRCLTSSIYRAPSCRPEYPITGWWLLYLSNNKPWGYLPSWHDSSPCTLSPFFYITDSKFFLPLPAHLLSRPRRFFPCVSQFHLPGCVLFILIGFSVVFWLFLLTFVYY